MLTGIDHLLISKNDLKFLKGKRVSLLAHPASVTKDLVHTADALFKGGVKLTSTIGPQHGMRGEKQDNMIESEDYLDPVHQVPVFSLYGKVRRPTKEMMDTFDVILVDLQDLGCRIYTFITTLLYVMEECQKYGKSVWVLDRPNPAGRPLEGFTLEAGWESFVGAAPFPMRYGLTIGELANWFKSHFQLNVDLKVIKMKGYNPEKSPGFGWPINDRIWVNPSPNAATVNMARCYSGSVLIEGTTLSEGRGTTRALEILGAPDIDGAKIIKQMAKLNSNWIKGCKIRECHFSPTFNKHNGTLCHGFQIHAEGDFYSPKTFRPFRLVALFLKSVRALNPEYPIWRDFPYEYETTRLAFDVINGGPRLKNWIDDKSATCDDLDQALRIDEKSWAKQAKKFYLYG